MEEEKWNGRTTKEVLPYTLLETSFPFMYIWGKWKPPIFYFEAPRVGKVVGKWSYTKLLE